ncbi:MAG: type I secretion system permease/ATPase [Halieaceae bacterium]|jgi:ATP-binding cassette, subfamily C, bacterial LapB|nr:type I secretion system permease/ATPase [Halieaceae bacterium]
MNTHDDDPLLQSLLALCRYHGRPTTAEALCGGLPLEKGCLSPSLFERAASRAGLASKVIKKRADEIDAVFLPAVILQEDQRACLLMGWDADGEVAHVIYPELNEAVVDVPASDMLEIDTTTAIICRPRFGFDKRVVEAEHTGRGHWFWSAIRGNAPIYKDVLVAAFFINLFGLAAPLFIRIVYDRVLPNNAIETMWMLVAGMLIIILAEFALKNMRGYFLDIAARRVDVKLSALIMERVLGMKLEHRPASVGSYMSNLRSFEAVRDFIASSTITTFIDLPFAVLFLIVIGWISFPMLYPIGVALALILAMAIITRGKLRELSETTYRAGAMRNSTLVEGLVGLDTIKAMGGEARMQRLWEENTAFASHVGVQLRLVSNSNINLTNMIQQALRVFIVVTGVYAIGEGELSMGGLIACLLLSARVIGPFSKVAGLLIQYNNVRLGLASLNQLMETPMERPEGVKFLAPKMFRGDIEFKNVSFSYPGSEMESLTDVSFKVKAGEHVAILGRVGCGKSTLQKLCMGLFQPSSGSITIDGIDLRQIDPAVYRSGVCYVPQDVTLFYGTLRENLLLSQTDVSDEVILRAVEIAGLSEFVNRHPQGLDMLIGERGDSLSGGQRRSVAMARALVGESSIVLMDEPTGSMDHSTEVLVKKHLENFIVGRTFMVVTHRNSLLALVDRIIVLDNGKVMADGPRNSVTEALQRGKIGKAQ